MNMNVRLVRDILLLQFGEQVTAVACALALKGRSPLGRVAAVSKKPVALVRQSLVILIQHGLVVYFAQAEGARQVIYYTLDVKKVVLRVRFPRFIKAAKDLYQDEGKQIVIALLLHGRLSLNELLTKVDTKYYEASALRETFIQMTHDRYLVANQTKDSLSNVDVTMKRNTEQLEKLGPLPSARDLKMLATSRAMQAAEELDNPIMVGMKRKPGMAADYSNKAYKTFDVDPEMRFTVNCNRFHLHFRNEVLIQTASQRINETAGKILKLVISLLSGSNNTSSSRTVSVAQVTHQINIKDLPMDHVIYNADLQQKVSDYLDLLEQAELLAKDSSSGAFALPEDAQLSSVLQGSYLSAYMQSRFGRQGARIYRALAQRGKMEEKQLATLTMVPLALARHLTYDMHLHGFLDLHPVPRTADRAPARTFFVFGTDPLSAANTVRQGLLQAICNASERLALTLEEARGGGAAVDARRRAAKRANALRTIAGEEEAAENEAPEDDLDAWLAKNKDAQMRLAVALQRIDRDLLLFE